MKSRDNSPFTSENIKEMLNFVADKAKKTLVPLSMSAVWNEYRALGKSERAMDALRIGFRMAIAPKLQRFEQFDIETTARILFATHVPVTDKMIEELAKYADVLELNEKKVIVRLEKGNLKLAAAKKRKAKNNDNNNTIYSKKVKTEQEEDAEEEEQCPILEREVKIEEEPEISLKNILSPLRTMLRVLDSSQLSGLLEQVDKIIKESGSEKVSIHNVFIAFNAVFMATHCSVGETSGSIDRSFVLRFIRSMILDLKSDELKQLQEQIEKVIEKNRNENYQISVSVILHALETALFIVQHRQN